MYLRETIGLACMTLYVLQNGSTDKKLENLKKKKTTTTKEQLINE